MNDMTVGMENLPNVFIEKIYIQRMELKTRIRIKMVMYDHSTERSWFRRPDMSGMQVKLLLADQIQSNSLQEGTSSLFDYGVGEEGVYVFSPSSWVVEEEINEFEKIFKIYEVEIDPVANLSVFVACFFDDIGFGIDLFDKYYGPMSGEKIFVGGEVNRQSGYFYYPDTNKEYAGPVHQKPNGSFMEGSAHSNTPHKNVRYVFEENFKISDASLAVTIGIFNAVSEEVPEDPQETETTLEGEEIGSGSSQTYTPPN